MAQSQLCLGLSVPGALLTRLGPGGPGWVSFPSGSVHGFVGPLAHCTHCYGLTTLWAQHTLGPISFHPMQPPKVGDRADGQHAYEGLRSSEEEVSPPGGAWSLLTPSQAAALVPQ